DARNQHYQTCDGCDEKQYSDHDYGTSGTCACGKTKPDTNVPAESVSLDKTDIELEVGGAGTKLTATVLPANATDKSVTYSVEPLGVVSVDNDGNVTALDEGTAVITVKTANDKKATCNVTVTKPLTNAEVLEFLNENYLLDAVKSAFPSTLEIDNSKITNITWYVVKDGDNITEANLLFKYLYGTQDNYVTLGKVDFTTPVTPQNIRENVLVASTYTRIYRNSIDPTIQAAHAELTNAICDKLFGVNENATRYIIDNGRNELDPQLGDVARYTVLEVTDSGIKGKSIKISYSTNDTTLIANLADTSKYATYGSDISHAITGEKLVAPVAPLTNAEVLEFLNENVTNKVAKKFADDNFFTFNASSVSNVTWYITKDGKNITNANITFTYMENATFKHIALYNVTFSTPLTPQNILNNEIGTCTYTKIYSNAYNNNIQAAHADLTNAICDKLFGEKTNATRYIIDDGFVAADPQLGDMSTFTVVEVTDTEIKQKSINIAYANTDSGLIGKLDNVANYRTYDEKSHAITGAKLVDNNEQF
ncbi:MAG: Ig domain-containing protein, partial [Clostridiales bacterium]|nr:Ig domain-containing protein [Clostridiales bacterium]